MPGLVIQRVTISISWEFSEAMLNVIFSLGKDPARHTGHPSQAFVRLLF